MWAAAWQADGMACCDGGMCAAHGHSKPNHSRPQQATHQDSPMDCEHHGGSGTATCSLSCCRESSPSLTSAMIFVLPAPTTVSQPAQAMAAPANFVPAEFVQSFEPLSPPPRLSLFSL